IGSDDEFSALVYKAVSVLHYVAVCVYLGKVGKGKSLIKGVDSKCLIAVSVGLAVHVEKYIAVHVGDIDALGHVVVVPEYHLALCRHKLGYIWEEISVRGEIEGAFIGAQLDYSAVKG